MIHPSHIIRQYKSGRGDMDEATAAFGIDEGWSLVRARLNFIGGSGTGLCYITVLHLDDPDVIHNARLFNFVNAVGVNSPANISVDTEGLELIHAFSFDARQRMVFNWTNPDPGDMQWGIEVGMIPWRWIT